MGWRPGLWSRLTNEQLLFLALTPTARLAANAAMRLVFNCRRRTESSERTNASTGRSWSLDLESGFLPGSFSLGGNVFPTNSRKTTNPDDNRLMDYGGHSVKRDHQAVGVPEALTAQGELVYGLPHADRTARCSGGFHSFVFNTPTILNISAPKILCKWTTC